MNDWGQPQDNWNSPGSGKPAAAKHGQKLTAEEIQIEATQSRGSLDPGDIIKSAFEHLKEKPVETIGVTIGLFVILFIFQFVVSFGVNIVSSLMIRAISSATDGSSAATTIATLVSVATSFGISFIVAMIQALLIAGINIMWLRIVRGQDVDLGRIIEVKNFAIPLILGGLVYQFAVTVGVMLFIVPGIILALGLYFWGLVVVDKGLGPIESLKASWELTDGHKVSVFIFALLLFVVNLVGMLACGLGLIVTMPLSIGATALYYNRLAEPGNAYLAPDEHNTSSHDVFS